MSRRIAALGLVLGCAGCASGRAHEGTGTVRIVTTMSTLASLASSVGGDRVTVANLVPIGASPEDYQPTPRDVERLHDADVLIENGGGLETWLDGTIASAGNPDLAVVIATGGMKLVGGNPHLWMDPVFARAYVEKIRAALAKRDPAGAPAYEANARAFDAKLDALTRRIAQTIARIPSARRKMLVFHDAWAYYDARFGLRTVGVIETSPGREPSPASLAAIVARARREHVHAAFTEPEYSPKLVDAIARSAGITTIAQLYDDSLGGDAHTGNYIAMLEYDTRTIAAALQK